MSWTPKTLKQYLDMRIDELEKSIDRRFAGQYSISGRLMLLLAGGAAFITVITAIARWGL